MSNNEKNKLKERLLKRGSFFLFLCGGVGLLSLDLWTKYLAFTSSFLEYFNNFRPLLGKELFRNYAFAFSWPVPEPLMYAIYSAVMLALVAYVSRYYQKFGTGQAVGWTLIFTGALANIGERLALGYVRDFIYIWHGIFNFADGYIILGVAILMTRMSKNDKIDKNGLQ